MKAILLREFGSPDNMYIGEVDQPSPSSHEVLVHVKATAINRADTLQRQGKYPPPPGANPIMGLEFSGVIERVGEEVTDWKVGDKVCGLLSGGGYAEYVTIHSQMLIPIPEGWTFEEAAAIPEVYLTAFQAVFYLGKFQKGEQILIHAGASGVGTAAIQLAKSLGASKIIITASGGKHELCKNLGADVTIDYKSENFEEVISKVTDGKGVNLIIDFLAAPYFQKNINSLTLEGRMVMLALLGGVMASEVNLLNILRRRLMIVGSTLRARSLEYKVQLTKDFCNYSLPKFQTGELKPIIDSVYDWKDVAEAHRYMEANLNKGKIILTISG